MKSTFESETWVMITLLSLIIGVILLVGIPGFPSGEIALSGTFMSAGISLSVFDARRIYVLFHIASLVVLALTYIH